MLDKKKSTKKKEEKYKFIDTNKLRKMELIISIFVGIMFLALLVCAIINKVFIPAALISFALLLFCVCYYYIEDESKKKLVYILFGVGVLLIIIEVKRNYLIILYDFYGELLNDKQKECFEDYYFNNLSLGEISENMNLSRNAIYKNIKTSEDKLYYYEDKLNLFKNREKLYEIVDTIDDENIKNKIKELY